MMLLLLMVLAACEKNIKEPMPEGQLENPPDVQVMSGDQIVKAVQGTTSWTINLGNGKRRGFEADSEAPMGLVAYQKEPMVIGPW